MTVVAPADHVSIADYLATEEHSTVKREFLRGMIFAMPSHSNLHNSIAGNALGTLHSQLRGKPYQPFNADTKIRLQLRDCTRFYYPDGMVVLHPNPASDHFQDLPVVVIEVLSESTRRTDLGEKRDAYLRLPSLKVLLLIETDTASVTLHRRRASGGFAIEHHAGLDAVIPLPEIEAQLPLADLYERVDFAS